VEPSGARVFASWNVGVIEDFEEKKDQHALSRRGESARKRKKY
jgi:hypothetical protein